MPQAHTHSTSFASHIGLGRTQFWSLVAIGAAGWFLAALILRWVGPLGAHEGTGQIITYLAVIPATFVLVISVLAITRTPRHQAAIACAVMTATATFLDGIALGWFSLYGDTAELTAGAGAAILWGAGVLLATGMVLNRRAADISEQGSRI